jgi:precorrin-2 dehydrogenase/sirohydrochlorin ferrochelatase
VAERKLRQLIDCGARAEVVSPRVTRWIEEMAGKGKVHWEARGYRPGDLKAAFLAIAATDDQAVNEAVAREAQAEGVLLNVVDKPELCTFIAPSVIRRGEVVLAISTGGLSPALARRIREALEGSKALEYADLAGVLSEVRRELRGKGVSVPQARWQRCIDEELLALVQNGQREEARERLLGMLLEKEVAG